MSIPGARIGRFVRAARSLLLMQLGAAVVAVVLGIWAVLAVRDMASERDQLRARVAELDSQRPNPVNAPAAAPNGPTASPLDTEIRPPAILPVPIPVVETAPDPVVDVPIKTDVDPNPATEEPVVTPTPTPEQDCSGANARLPRCRPGRWNRGDPVLRRPLAPVRPEPQQPTPR
jgi:hypothetical protein